MTGACVLGIALSNATPPRTSTSTFPLTPAEKAYIEALTAIDPDIVHGKPDKALGRGYDQCATIAGAAEGATIETATRRFTSPAHPEGFETQKVIYIIDAVRIYLCPPR